MSHFRILDTDETRRISDAIRDAERGTYGEIVPVVAEASGRYDRAEDIFGVLVAGALVSVGWLANSGTQSSGGWSSTDGPGLAMILVLLGAGFALGALLASRVRTIRKLFISRKEMREEVERRARECFHLYGIGRTRGSTGVLIYISLEEQMVRIEGDHTVARELPAARWQAVCDTIVNGIRGGDTCEALIDGIQQTGELLSREFPAARDAANTDELDNTVHQIAAA